MKGQVGADPIVALARRLFLTARLSRVFDRLQMREVLVVLVARDLEQLILLTFQFGSGP